MQDALPKIVLAPSFAAILVFVYGFILWTIYLSFTNSKTFPSYELTGGLAYQRLWGWTFDSDPPNPDADRNDVGAVASVGWTY